VNGDDSGWFLQHGEVEGELRLKGIGRRVVDGQSSPKRGLGCGGGLNFDVGSGTPVAGVDKRLSRWGGAAIGRVGGGSSSARMEKKLSGVALVAFKGLSAEVGPIPAR
jgi:hypothetical protein